MRVFFTHELEHQHLARHGGRNDDSAKHARDWVGQSPVMGCCPRTCRHITHARKVCHDRNESPYVCGRNAIQYQRKGLELRAMLGMLGQDISTHTAKEGDVAHSLV